MHHRRSKDRGCRYGSLECRGNLRCQRVDREAVALLGIGSPVEGCRGPSYILVITVISAAVGQGEEAARRGGQPTRGGRSRTQDVFARCRGAATGKEVTIKRLVLWRCSSRRATIITELFRPPRRERSASTEADPLCLSLLRRDLSLL